LEGENMAKENTAEEIKELEKEVEQTAEEIKEVEKPKKDNKKKDSEAYMREKVPVMLIKDKQRQDNVIVRVNGFSVMIERGKQVMVPRYIKEVLDNQYKQEMAALEASIEMQMDPNDKAFQ
jgi:hypothetical protein